MQFKIETAKWSWAETVHAKEIYRDEEFVITNSKEEALLSIDFLMNQAKGLTYTITTFKNDQYYTYFRHSMPCLGGLVKYKASHGEKYFMNPYFPRDIRVAFPDGDIIFIAVHRPNIKIDIEKPYYKFILSDESPWKTAFEEKNTIIFKANYFVLTNMDTDPTVFYSIMRLGAFTGYNGHPTRNPKADILAKSTFADPRRLAGQKPIKISGGTWKQGFGYTRPYNESIFKTSLPTKYEDFGKLAGYPQAPYKSDYFIQEMKNMFKIDLSQGIDLQNDRIEKALVESWDYFKEKSKDLNEFADVTAEGVNLFLNLNTFVPTTS